MSLQQNDAHSQASFFYTTLQTIGACAGYLLIQNMIKTLVHLLGLLDPRFFDLTNDRTFGAQANFELKHSDQT